MSAAPRINPGEALDSEQHLEWTPLGQWLREAGRVTVVDEGEQALLFENDWQRMYRLYNAAGASILVPADEAQRFGLKPTPIDHTYQAPTGCLFPHPQGELFA